MPINACKVVACLPNHDRNVKILSAIERGKNVGCETAGGTKTSSTTNTIWKLSDNSDFWGIDPLDDQLCNSVTVLDSKVLLAEIEQQHLEWATVIFVNDTGTDINRVLGR